MRTTIGTDPPHRYLIFAALFTSWLKPVATKSLNWISPIGRWPASAAPTHTPSTAPSASGELAMRSPNSRSSGRLEDFDAGARRLIREHSNPGGLGIGPWRGNDRLRLRVHERLGLPLQPLELPTVDDPFALEARCIQGEGVSRLPERIQVAIGVALLGDGG